MSLQVAWREYRELLKVMLFPLPWIKYVLWLCLVALVGGFPFYLWIDNKVVFIPAASLLGGFILILIIFMPIQALSLLSSKQINLLADVRKRLIIILLGLCIISAPLISVVMFYGKVSSGFFPILGSVLLVVSVLICWSIILGTYWQAASGVVFLLFFALVQLGQWLLSIPPGVNILLAALNWVILVFRVFKWKPQKYLRNALFSSQTEMFEAQVKWQSLNGRVRIKPKTLLGSWLQGRADGLLGDINASMGGALGIVTAFIPLGLSKSISEKPDVMSGIFTGFLPIFVFIVGMNTMMRIGHCIKRIWMYFPGSRRGIFNYLEISYYKNSAIGLVFSLLFFVGVAIAGFVKISGASFILMVLMGILQSSLLLYVGICVYVKFFAHMKLMWLALIASIIILLGEWFLLAQINSSVILYQEAVLALMVQLLLVVFVRHWAIKLWPNVSFQRAV